MNIGKADTLAESAFQIARREAYEEIGLPLSGPLPGAFTVEHLCQLPTYLARTEVGVRPCIALLSPLRESSQPARNWANANSTLSAASPEPAALRSAEEILIPQLDAKEVAAVFTAPVYSFLKLKNGPDSVETGGEEGQGSQRQDVKDWYQGIWTEWYDDRWRMHNFYVPTAGELVARQKKPRGEPNEENLNPSRPTMKLTSGISPLPYREHKPKHDTVEIQSHFRVFGMTARIMVDAARLAYNEESEFEHNPRFGDEDLIQKFLSMGKLGPKGKCSKSTIDRDLAAAAKI